MKKSAKKIKYKSVLAGLIETRKQSKMTQERLAAKLGKKQAYISKIELNQRKLDLKTFLKICRALKISPDEVLKGE